MRLISRFSAGLVITALLAACTDSSVPTPTTKNVIFFLGDGMGMTTLTAARIYSAGEDGQLTIDSLPESGFVKTYSNDAQVTDSAPSMSAYMTGVKMNNDVISMSSDTRAFQIVNGGVVNFVSGSTSTCPSGNGTPATTVLELAKSAGMGTGVVTTARLTHATPAAAYAHICHRDGEFQIAAQAVPGGAGFNAALGDGVDVLLGGTSTYWRPVGSTGLPAGKGRTDSRDLVEEMKAKGYTSVTTRDQLLAAPNTGKILGLFDQAIAQGHMSYELDRNPSLEPSIAEMTTKAIDVLSRNAKGYFLMVEGGRIDHALHSTFAKRALADTVAFDQAIAAAIAKVDLKNTLIVVTADHDHTLVMNGYAQRTGKTTSTSPGVLGLVKDWVTGLTSLDINGWGYSILGFGTGENRSRTALDDTTASGLDYHQEAVIPMSAGGETHGGADVFIGAIGNGAESVTGVMENTAVFAILKKGLGLN